MNNGNFGGYDPKSGNGNDPFGFMGGYDPNQQNNVSNYQNQQNQQNVPYTPYQNTPYQNNGGYNDRNPYQNNGYQTQPYQNNGGYAPYHGGTYSNPTPNNPYQQSSYQPMNNSSFGQSSYENQGTSPYQPPTYQNAGFGNAQTAAPAVSLSDYSKRVFLWMGAGLALTFFVALGLMLYLTSGGEADLADKFSGFLPLFYGGLVVEVVLAIALSFFVAKMPYGVSLAMFLVYSVVSGVTFTPLLVVYDVGSSIFAFAAAAVLFIGFAIYGIVTKRDLMKLGPILMIGLIVLLVFSVIGIFVHMSVMSMIVSIVGILIFIGLTAYDTQKIRVSYENLSHNPEMLKKMSVNMALQLYLDFINLFIYLLRLLGKARR